MPTYSYRDNKTKKEITISMTIAEMEVYEKNNSHVERIYNVMNIVDPAGIGVSKPSNDFTKHVLGRIKAKNPHSVIGNGRWSIPREF